MRIRKLNHSVYQVQYHVVWGTKYRRKVLKHYVRTELIKGVYKVLNRHPDWYMHQINTGDDYVHIRIEIPPKYRVSDAVQQLKIETSKVLQKRFRFIRQAYRRGSMWSVGYFVSTVGLNEDQIKKYIEKQNNYDKGVDVTSEFS